ncbi:unnamed protein product [Rotaria sordida]|uniref:F-box domain-containing protein n=1 Tax=Rotaria sordida TaxID=392033 RepID=A0A819BUQ5_9BILA|nr:unnamed protein product [Rotaria sordida]CAF1367959.1 unnamed protein product [Rotaria sordida]CAF1429155.1 unnamed protein product [Rotaria sordida]CAF3809670.1 unnamed protein product [Rotaria sordida]CAF3822742.1 unnamed protein product [Rotaria sordida]
MSISSIESLSNEIFYEIFDYFDASDIYFSFSNLNHRFHQLINSSSLLFKLTLGDLQANEIFMNNYQKIFLHNKNQILSIHLWSTENTNEIISSIIFDSSFNYLESLVFYAIELDVLISVLPKLTYLSRLLSLTIDIWSNLKDLADIYRLIFNLPKLKYIKFAATESNDDDITISLPMATNEQISSIEYLIMDHPCAIDELFAIISYTPYLRRLKFLSLTDRNVNIRSLKPMILPNLTHLSIRIYRNILFDEFEIFINKLNSKIKILSLTTTFEDIAYLDANRWEKFILTKLPQLEKFYFKYRAYFVEDYETPMYLGERDQFISSFWLQRRWILDIEVEFENIIYSIRPYQKRWYEYDTEHKLINSSDELSKSIRLSLYEICLERWAKTIFINDYINHALNVTQIYQLEIDTKIFSNQLMEILRLLPEVNTLKIYSLSILQQGKLSEEELEFLYFLSNKNQIRKICFENMKEMDELYMLSLICSHVNHLQINCVDYVHVALLTRVILTQIKSVSNSLLRLLCFCIQEIHDDMIEKLENMIYVENLRFDFMIKHVMDKIYLQWK